MRKPRPFLIVLTGNPNSGKTTLFNALTGLRAKVGNYAGVTVERKEGRLKDVPSDLTVTVLDLPGSYSLSPQSIDEQIARDVLFHRLAEVPPPNLVVAVVDASNLERNLYYATQVLELGFPVIIALNMIDVAEDNGHHIDCEALAQALGVPVVPMIANQGEGVAELRARVLEATQESGGAPTPRSFCRLPAEMSQAVEALAGLLDRSGLQRCISAPAEALLVLSDERIFRNGTSCYPDELPQAAAAARQRLAAAGLDWRSAAIEARYACAGAIHQAVTTERLANVQTFSDRLDQIVTHRVWGVLIFVGLMTLMFESLFTFARGPMTALQFAVDAFGHAVGQWIPPGDLNSLLVDGAIEGVGAVVVFLPQILLLFLFLGLLEDTGYMARAAFLMDRLMSKVGLHGKSFIPLLSSFACAIPGLMATRTIESPKARLVTILVAPLMSCSARLPVYTLLIAACVPNRRVLGLFGLQGLTLLAMYLLGTVVALGMAWLFKKTLLQGEPPLLVMELPPYRRPVLEVVLQHMWDRSRLFLRRAGTVILGASILLWFLATYPRSAVLERKYAQLRSAVAQAGANYRKPGTAGSEIVPASLAEQLNQIDRQEAGERLRHSFAGRLGQLLEPAIQPLGLDWKIGIGILASFAAREVFVSTMATVYNVSEYDKSAEGTQVLAKALRTQVRPDGRPVYTALVAVTLMVFYVFALQCVSTVAVVRRETNSWEWPLFQWLYMGALAWLFAFVTYQGGRLLGWE